MAQELIHHCQHCGSDNVEDMELEDGADMYCFACCKQGASAEWIETLERAFHYVANKWKC